MGAKCATQHLVQSHSWEMLGDMNQNIRKLCEAVKLDDSHAVNYLQSVCCGRHQGLLVFVLAQVTVSFQWKLEPQAFGGNQVSKSHRH